MQPIYGFPPGGFPPPYGSPQIYRFPNQQFPSVPGLYFPHQSTHQPPAPDPIDEWNVPTPYHFSDPPKVGEYSSTNPKFKKEKLESTIGDASKDAKAPLDPWLQSWKEKFSKREGPHFSRVEILEKLSNVQNRMEELKQKSISASNDEAALLRTAATDIEKTMDELNDPITLNLFLCKQQKRLRKKVSYWDYFDSYAASNPFS